MVVRVIFCLLIFNVFNSCLIAQDKTIDSLKLALQNAKHDTTRCVILNTIVDSSTDDNLWPAYNEQMKKICEAQLKIILSTDPLRLIYLKYLSISLSNLGYLDQMQGKIPSALSYYLKSLELQKPLGYKLGITTNLNNISVIYKSQGEFPKALDYYKQNLKVQEEINDKEGIGVSLNNIGALYRDQGDIPNALDYYSKSLRIRKEIKDEKGIANSLNNLALLYQETGNISKAVNLNHESLKIWEGLKDKSGMATSLTNIGLLFSKQEDFSKALEYYNKSLEIEKEIGDKSGIGASLNNIGFIYTRFGNTEKALEYYRQSLKIREELGEKSGVAMTLNNIGTIYDDNKNYVTALEYYKKSLSRREEIGTKEGIAYSLNSIANVYFKQKQNKEALEYAQRELKLANEIGYPVNIRYASLLLSKIYASNGNYKAAYDMYVLFHQMNDSIKNETNRKNVLQKTFQYKFEKQEAEAKLLQQQSEVNRLKLQDQESSIRKQRYMLFLSFGVICLILLSSYYYISRQKLVRLRETENAIRQTEESERQRIAKDIHDELGSGLSKIKFLSELANSEAMRNQQSPAHLNSISQTASGLVENMRDLVWAMNPENTTVDNLVARIREYSNDYLDEFPIDLKVNTPEIISTIKISKEIYRNTFMIVKEVLQNIVKHASASMVYLNISVTDKINLEIADNGMGFNPEGETSGNGLKNIRTRSNFIQAKLTINSNSKGSMYELEIPLKT